MPILNLERILNMLKGNSIEAFDCPECKIGDPEIEQIAKPLADNTSLRSIDLSRNPISIGGLQKLSESLSHHPGVEELTLESLSGDGEPKGPAYIHALAPIFGNPQLKELILDGNNFDSAAIQLLAKILKKNTTLEFLSIDNYRRLDGLSDAALAATMENNKTLILNVYCD
jgi:Ran GTPase-activating protein (RanGAP) involved in mRNA processing and transport